MKDINYKCVTRGAAFSLFGGLLALLCVNKNAAGYTDLTDFQPPPPSTRSQPPSPLAPLWHTTNTTKNTTNQVKTMMNLRATLATLDTYIDKNTNRIIEEQLFPVIQARCVSAEKSSSEMQPCAELVASVVAKSGLQNIQILQENESYPAVFGEIRSPDPAAKTILIQGHYDGQPSNEKEWTITRPHEPKIVPSDTDRRVYGRGTSDDWGQVLTHLATVQAYRESGMDLPVNLKFLIEGGEERGSKDMDKLIQKYRNLLAADVVMITDSAPGREDHPVITTSARGLAGAYVRLQVGKDKPHSGDNIADNAVAVLASLLTSMKDYRTGRIQIPHFYDPVDILSDEQRQKLQQIPFDTGLFTKTYGLSRIVTEEGFSAQETMWTRPSYEIHTIVGGEKSNNMPHKAEAYVTMRIVPHQNPQGVFDLFRNELYRRLGEMGLPASALKIDVESLGHPFSTSTEHPYFAVAEQAMAEAFNDSVDYMGCGGTEPIALFHQQILNVPVIFNAYNSPKDHYHGNDESFSIERGFIPGVKANVRFYNNIAEVNP